MKKKTFYFEDYDESELTEKNKSSTVRISLNRITFLSFVFFVLKLILVKKIFIYS
jgi:hypothetical protein